MDDFAPEKMALLIPFFVIVFGSAIPICLCFFNYLRRRRFYELYHQERMAAIEKGIELPPLPEALLHKPDRMSAPGRTLLKGLIWLFIGIGVFIALGQENRREAAFGIIPAGIGVAYLIYYFVEGRHTPAPKLDDGGPDGALPAPAKS